VLIIAIVFLLLTALFGSILLNAILKNKRPPQPIVLLHGSAAFLSLLILVSYIAAGHTDYILIASFICFIIAALGGTTLLIFEIKRKPLPKVVALLHPLLGLIAFVLLIIYFLR